MPNLLTNQSSHLISASPTWHAGLDLGLVPKEMSSRLAGWQEQAIQSICPFNTSQRFVRVGEEKIPSPKPTQGAEVCRSARDPNATLLHNRQGSLLDYWCSQIGVPMLDGQCAHYCPPLTGIVLEASWSKPAGSEESSALPTTTSPHAEGLAGLTAAASASSCPVRGTESGIYP